MTNKEYKLEEKDIFSSLHALKVISSIREHDKLLTKRGLFVDQCENYWQPVTRWFYSESRLQNISSISTIFNKTFLICFALLHRRQEIKEDDISWLPNIQTLQRLVTEIKNAQRGLVNLIVTYRDDTHTVASIVLLNENIQDKLQQIDHHCLK
jgi:hypothetical protein